MRGIQRRPQETLHDFALRCDGALGPSGLPSIAPIVYGYAAQVYGNHPARTADFEAMYRTLRGAATPWARFRLALQRIFTVSLPGKSGKMRGK